MRAFSCLLLAAMLAWPVEAGSRLIMVRVEQPQSAWSNPRLYEKLATTLTREPGIQVTPAEPRSALERPFPQDALDDCAIADWATVHQAHYVMVVLVRSERLETRKTFNVPLIFHKYESFGVIEGELRLIDVTRGRQVRAVPFAVELSAGRIFQGSTDDDINDPDLHLTSPDKLKFFSRLEDKLVAYLWNQVRGPIGRHDREYVAQPQSKN